MWFTRILFACVRKKNLAIRAAFALSVFLMDVESVPSEANGREMKRGQACSHMRHITSGCAVCMRVCVCAC